MLFFKYLVKNDIGKTSHQAGPVIPALCLEYFPFLRTDLISAENPTQSEYLRCSLFFNGDYIAYVTCRFQFQTWRGTRKPEYRITGGLGELMKGASVGDLLMVTRISMDEYRIDIHSDTSAFRGYLDESIQKEIIKGLDYITQKPSGLIDIAVESQIAQHDHTVFEKRQLRELTQTARVLRDPYFRQSLLDAYEYRCAISNERLHIPNTKIVELEGAHIIPVGSNGSDHVTNGLLLNRRLHWAFDRGMFNISDDYRVQVALPILESEENVYLHQFNKSELMLPRDQENYPSPVAIKWHRDNVLLPS